MTAPEPQAAHTEAGEHECEFYDKPDQDCITAGPEVIAAEGLCGLCATRLLTKRTPRRAMSEESKEFISDEGLGYLILGCFRAVPTFEEFPIKIRGVVDNVDDEGTIENFSIITESGLKYTVSVTFDGQVE